MLARFVIATGFVALVPLAAGATTPFSDRCEGNICFQRKVNMGCMTQDARQLLREIADRFGMIEVASACDGRHARRSAHYVGKAFDFRPYSAQRGDVIAFLKASPRVGGVGTYHNGLIHADVADRKMAWHGSGRGRVVWPIGAGTIEKSPEDAAPAAQASASSFPFNLWGRQAAPESEKVMAAAIPAGNGMDLAPAPAGSATPPLPPRRPALLAGLVAGQAADAASLARAGDPAPAPSAFGEVGQAAAPAPILGVSSSPALSGAPSEVGQRSADPVAPAAVPGFAVVGAERPAAPPAAKGFGADESLFSARPLTQPSQPGFSMAAYSPSLISPPRSPY